MFFRWHALELVTTCIHNLEQDSDRRISKIPMIANQRSPTVLNLGFNFSAVLVVTTLG